MSRALSILPAMFMVAVSFLALAVPPASGSEPAAFNVEKSGDGRPVVFIPGLSSSGEVWTQLKGDLGDGYETHVVTLAGFAGVPPVEGSFMETRLAALKDYLEVEDMKDAVVIGHSLGGAMAMMLALEAPGRVGDVVIVDSVPFLAQFFLGAANAEGAKPGAGAIKAQLLQLTDEQYAAQQRQFAMTQARDKESQAKIVASSLASDRATVAEAMYELLTTDLRADVANIAAPMLVLYPWRAGGPFSAEQTDGAYAAQYGAAKTANLKRIDDSAHFIMFDQPEATAEAIRAFLAQ